MHEMTIAMGIINIAEENARLANAKKINEIEIEIGTLSGVVIEALEFALDSACRNTVLDSAKRKINIIDARAKCNDCGKEFGIEDFYGDCPGCHSWNLEVIKGKELRVKSLNID